MSNPSTRWLPIDPNTFDPDRQVTQRGVEFHVVVSPYDLPDAVRGHFDPALQRFVIEFRYFGDEKARTIVLDPHVTLHVGTQSSRIQRIEVDVKGLGANQVALKMAKAIESLRSVLSSRHVPDGNFAVAKHVITRKSPELMGDLTAAR